MLIPISQFISDYLVSTMLQKGPPWWPSGKESTCQCQSCGLDPWVRKLPGEEMVTHSSILAWEIPWTEEPGR